MPFNYKTELNRYRRYYQAIEDASKKPKANAYTKAIFSFLAVSLFGWYAILPTLRTIFYLKREIVDNIKVNKQMDNKIANLIEAQANFQKIEPQLALVNQALPDKAEAVSLLTQLKNLVSVSQASISSLQVSAVSLGDEKIGTIETAQSPSGTPTPAIPQNATISKPQNLSTIPVIIVLTGPYESLLRFIQDIVSMRRIATIEDIDIEPNKQVSTGEQQGKLLMLTIRLMAYYTPGKDTAYGK